MDYAIITSLELDHTDYYKDWEDYQSAFLQMLENVKENCFVLENLASEKVKSYEKIEIVPELSFDFKNIRGKHQEQNASLVFALLNFLTEGKKKKKSDHHWKIFIEFEEEWNAWLPEKMGQKFLVITDMLLPVLS